MKKLYMVLHALIFVSLLWATEDETAGISLNETINGRWIIAEITQVTTKDEVETSETRTYGENESNYVIEVNDGVCTASLRTTRGCTRRDEGSFTVEGDQVTSEKNSVPITLKIVGSQLVVTGVRTSDEWKNSPFDIPFDKLAFEIKYDRYNSGTRGLPSSWPEEGHEACRSLDELKIALFYPDIVSVVSSTESDAE